MLKLAGVTARDVVYDLGCGDGRIVITAAKKYGATGTGIDIDPERITEATENAKKSGVGQKVKFIKADLFDSDFREASGVTLYLLSTIILILRPILLKKLTPGTRIVSHAFYIGHRDHEQTKQRKRTH